MKVLASESQLPKLAARAKEEGSIRWLYPDAKFYWFVSGVTNDPDKITELRYRIMRDMSTLGAACRKINVRPIALCTSTLAAPTIDLLLRSNQGWKSLLVGQGALAMPNEDANRVCLNSANVILCYGNPTASLNDALSGIEENPPELVVRKLRTDDKEHKPLIKPDDDSPYSRFRTDVERLRHWRPSPTKGLQVRDQIDMRPQFKV